MDKVGRQEFDTLVFDLSMRPQIFDAQIKDFIAFYRIPEERKDDLKKYHSLNAFYFVNEDDIFLVQQLECQ